MTDGPELFQFVETAVFTKRIDRLTTIETLVALQQDLLKDPERGGVMEGCGGARKARIGDKAHGRGKRGSFRYIYVLLKKAGIIYLLMFYGKNEKDDLTKDEKKVIAALVKQLKETYGER